MQSVSRLNRLVVSSSSLSGRNRKRFVFHEEDNLVFCPVSVILALALVDNAFEADITTPEQVFQLEIPAEREYIYLK